MAKYYVDVTRSGTFWYKDPEMLIFHREGGPACEFKDGDKYWCINGQYHREDGPAIETDCYKEWWIKDQRHREDGPAIEGSTGDVQYWLNNQRLTKAEWEAATRPPEEMTVAQIEKLLGKKIKIIK